ncbi:MAG: transketolase [Desulfovibrio sp.]|nr:transketolase [Desulfovibrio sp.]
MPTRRQLADAIRVLSMDAIEKAHSGHPGAPLGMADMAEALWRHAFRHNPANPAWADRDRFVLSNGHASMLLYSLLHLTGYDLPMEEIRNFRQLASRTPGHPEYGVTPGVDISTGPLGQGISSAVGMALAERLLASAFNRPGHIIVDHRTWCFCGDGCLMEGVSSEACSLAGTWGLGRLIVLYDSNGISIDGDVSGWFGEDVAARYRAYGWQVIGPVDGHDCDSLDRAIAEAKADEKHPTLIICRTHIGYGSPKTDSASCHGSPLGEDACAAARAAYGWKEPPFVVPEDIRKEWDAREKGAEAEAAWNNAFAEYEKAYPDLAAEFRRRMAGRLPDGWAKTVEDMVQSAIAAGEKLATRKASQKALDYLVAALPELLGGSADLTGSVCTLTSHSERFNAAEMTGNHISYGVREFGMSCILNGIALHGGFIPYAGTFMSFSDQAKNALRLAAIMQVRAVWVFTHDSIGVGEDGPTHQPVEQFVALRTMPGMKLWRPCDTVETAVAWKRAISDGGPACLALSRQTLPYYSRAAAQVADIEKGGYVLRDCEAVPEIILIATGSEVALAEAAWAKLSGEGYRVRVVSMPCAEIFDAQSDVWKEHVLPHGVRRRIAIEAASPDYWWKYVGLDGRVIGMSMFGASAPAGEVAEKFGFTASHVIEEAHRLLAQ